MSLVTGLFSPVILLNQQWSPTLRLQASHCSTFRIMCDVPSIAVFCSESIECFPGTASKFFLIIIIIIVVVFIVVVTTIITCLKIIRTSCVPEKNKIVAAYKKWHIFRFFYLKLPLILYFNIYCVFVNIHDDFHKRARPYAALQPKVLLIFLEEIMPADSFEQADTCRLIDCIVVLCCVCDSTVRNYILLLLLLLSSSSSSSPLCRVFILIFLRQTMSLGNTVLQLFCCFYSWCLYRYLQCWI